MTLHTWQFRTLWMRSGKGPQDLSLHFHPMILYKETSHSSVFSIVSAVSGRRNEEATSPPLPVLKAHSLQQPPTPRCPGLDLVNKWQPSPRESCRLTANMEQLEEDPAFFTLHKHWGLCSPSCSRKNQRISLPPKNITIARLSYTFSHPQPPLTRDII